MQHGPRRCAAGDFVVRRVALRPLTGRSNEGAEVNKPSINGPRSGKPFIVLEAETKSELESKVEEAWREGYRPTGGIAVNRDPVNYALYYLQGMTLKED